MVLVACRSPRGSHRSGTAPHPFGRTVAKNGLSVQRFCAAVATNGFTEYLPSVQYFSGNEKGLASLQGLDSLSLFGSPTWARTRDLRINRSAGTWLRSTTQT